MTASRTNMAQAKYYSPRIQRTLISPLYHTAKAQGIPMTALASRLVAEGLDYKTTARTPDPATRIANYKMAWLDDRTAHDLVVRALDVGVCPNRQIPAVLQEWRKPHHDAFDARNVWSLFNAFTEALKGNLIELPRRTEALHGLLDNYVGLSA